MIAIDARYVRERPSGIGAMVEALVRLVPPLMPEQRFLLLRHPRAPKPLSREPNVSERTVRAEANGPATLLALPRFVDLSGVRLFHAPFNILPAGLPMPTIATVHDLMWLTDPALCGARGVWGLVQTAFFRNGIRRALRCATRIIAVSTATRRAIAAAEPQAAQRTVVIEHGIDAAFAPLRTEAQQQAAAQARSRRLPGARRHVMVVGQGAPYKNHGRALEAFLRAFSEEPDVHLALVQRLDRDARHYCRLARVHGARERVHVLAAVSRDELLALYHGAICLCQPSLVEGWGMPVSEAMAAGCPVVASNIEVLQEVTQGAAVHVDPHDAGAIASGLRRVADDGELRAELVAAGLARARELTWQRHAERTAELYRRVLNGEPDPAQAG
jgi:glycosyltransferase involved in cell wall biosynthesis